MSFSSNPGCLISAMPMNEVDRRWFKSKVGIEANEISRIDGDVFLRVGEVSSE